MTKRLSFEKCFPFIFFLEKYFSFVFFVQAEVQVSKLMVLSFYIRMTMYE